MRYNTTKAEPPEWIYNSCKSQFGADMDNGVVFTVGDTIHTRVPLPIEVVEHEKVHMEQQSVMGVDNWWAKYLSDVEFRLNQELPAYRIQYSTYKEMNKDRNKQAKMLREIGLVLSGPLYGKMISFSDAVMQVAKR